MDINGNCFNVLLWDFVYYYNGLMMIKLVFLLPLLFLGCANKPLVKVETKEVLIPIKCNVEIPKKPLENGSFKSHKELSIYFLQVEALLKKCVE